MGRSPFHNQSCAGVVFRDEAEALERRLLPSSNAETEPLLSPPFDLGSDLPQRLVDHGAES